MIFPGDVGLFRWVVDGLFGFVKRRRERQQPLYQQASRFIKAFEAHGVSRQQVPRLMPDPIRLPLQKVASPEELSKVVQLEHLDWASQTLALQRDWFDGEGEQPHQIVREVYKSPAAQHRWLQARTSIRPGYYSALHLVTEAEFADPGQAHGGFVIVYEEAFAELGDKSLSRYWYLSNGSSFRHTPCTIDVLSMLSIGESLGVSSVGHVVPASVIARAESGTLGLLPKSLLDSRRWQPRDWVPTGYDQANCQSAEHRVLWAQMRERLEGDGLQRLLTFPR